MSFYYDASTLQLNVYISEYMRIEYITVPIERQPDSVKPGKTKKHGASRFKEYESLIERHISKEEYKFPCSEWP